MKNFLLILCASFAIYIIAQSIISIKFDKDKIERRKYLIQSAKLGKSCYETIIYEFGKTDKNLDSIYKNRINKYADEIFN
jgi:hypothetical protein